MERRNVSRSSARGDLSGGKIGQDGVFIGKTQYVYVYENVSTFFSTIDMNRGRPSHKCPNGGKE